MRISVYQSLASLALVLAACAGKPKEEQTPVQQQNQNLGTIELSEAQVRTAGVQLGKVEERQISGVIKVNGLLDVPPQQLISVSVPLGGFLKSTDMLQGTRVHKGQLLAVMENPEYIQLQQDYLEARNQLEFSKADYDRQQELAKENVNAVKTLQQSKANYLNAVARKSGLQAKLKLINVDFEKLEQGVITSTGNVYSPINGFVTQVNVNIGKFVNPADVLFKIVDTEHLHAELTIFEKDIPKIRIGQKVRFTLANEASERTATVYLIGREIRPDRTITIHCHIDKEDKDLLPGMYLKAVIETGGARVTALPDEAIVDYQGRKYVIIPVASTSGAQSADNADGKRFRLVEITVGSSEAGYTEVNLPEGFDRRTDIVVKGGYAILSKMMNSEDGALPGH